MRSAMALLAVLAAVFLPSGRTSAAACPAGPPRPVTLGILAAPQRGDLARIATAAAARVLERAGFTVTVRPVARGPIPGSACTATLVVQVSPGAPQAFAAAATWYYEPLIASATFVRPDGRHWRATATEMARWFGEETSRAYTPGPPRVEISLSPERFRAEQDATRRGTTVSVERVLAAVGPLPGGAAR